MCKKNYVPLHNHSHYSALDGYGTIDEYVEMAKELGFSGFGLADHGTASGIYSFIKKMQDAGLTPVPGVEFYVAPENELGAKAKHQIFYGENGNKSSKYDVSRGAYTHLTVFAYNNEGLSNLFKLTSMSYHKDHFYTSPRIDTNMLIENSEGLIVTTGCPSSEISTRFLLGQDDKAYEYAMRMKSIFGDNYYVEIMDHKMENEELERILIPKQIKLARDLDIKIIATNDSHYAKKEDAIGQEHFLAMSTKAKMTDKKKDDGGTRFAFSGDEYYIKDYDEMYKVYPKEVAEEALHNTLEIVEKCKGISLDYRDDLRPFIPIPEKHNEATYLQQLIYDGFLKKRGHLPREVQEESVRRIQEEFKVIHSNDFLSYFLVVNDYIQFAHDNGIGVGAGRGCFEAGSKVRGKQGRLKNIEDIKVGDVVQTHDTTYQKVEDLFVYDVKNEDMVELTLSNGNVIKCTGDHLIFHKDRGFVRADELSEGDVLLGPKGRREKFEYKCDNCENKITVDKQGFDNKVSKGNYKPEGQYWCYDCVKSNLTKIPAVKEGLIRGAQRQKDADVKEKMSDSLKKHWSENYDERMDMLKSYMKTDKFEEMREKRREKSLQRYSDPEELKKLSEIGNGKYKSGKFISYQQNEKEIYYASSYELKALTILETDSNVESFDRSNIRIKYTKPSTCLIHNYLPDFEVKMKDGTKKIIEVKAKWQLGEEDTKSKLEQASIQLEELGYTFEIWTEDSFEEMNDEWHNDIVVEKVVNYKFTGKVYDIQVANVHNYNVAGVTVHNSIGGSEIAYVLDISNTDPIRFDLLFERFLSPGRGSLYEITYDSGEKEEIAVSQKKAKFLDDNVSKIVYVHELKAGDLVNFEDSKKKIQNIYVKVPGSAPDVDTDFHSKRREEVIDYCINKYGRDKVAMILTFGTFKAKKAFKAIASLHKIPFAASHKISSLLTSDDIMLKDVFDPSSKTYKETADFRNAVEADEKLMEIVKVATGLEGRISEVSAHPCGVIISSKTIADKAPTLVRQEDNRILTQWEYPELEDLGFIKMDLLGLELIDSIQATLANIETSNASSEEQYKREIPNMRELIEGEMDDAETYENLKQGNTVGIFQLGGDGVRELLRAAKPEAFMEIANITALYRPGPMKSGAHIQYSNRKNEVEEISYIHPDFHGTEVEEILKETFGLMIFQEQIMLIAGRYAGFTPYETDKLRKAVGKKKMKIMMEMKPKFVEGCLKKGASSEAAETLWETIRVFGEYGFNKCAWADTLISTPNHGKILLKDLYKMQESNPEEEIEVYSMYEDGSIKPHKVKNIVYSGRKPVYTIKTESGKKIKITKEHRMLTTDGYGTIEDGALAVGVELIVDNEWIKRLHPETISKRKAMMSELNKTSKMRESSRKRMTDYQSTLTFEDRSSHQSKISANSNRHEICLPIARAKLEELRKDPIWSDKFSKACEAIRIERYESGEYKGFGKQTKLSNGVWCDSMVEALAGEYLLSRGVQFEVHKKFISETNGSIRTCDFYADGLYFEMDGLNRGREYFQKEKYGEIPFVYMTPLDYKDVIDEALMVHHIENGDKIVEIIPPKETSRGIQIGVETYDIEMEDTGPSNFIAEGMVSHNSHSVSYAINIYQTIYLKTHYPADFMAAVIHQANKSPEKLKRLIQEATRMNLRIGAVEINSSQVETSSTGINPNREYDIVYGFSGVAQLNEVLSAEIVKERNENGPYTSVVNFIERILKKYDIGAAVLSNLALAGAFDSFGVSRKLIKEKAKALIDSCAKKEKKGTSLFDLMGTGESVAESIEIKGEDYTYNEMIKEEANVVGMFLSGHPVSNLGHISKSYKAVFVEDVIKSEGRGKTFNVFGTITAMKAKRNKTGKKTVAIQIDDSKTVVPTWLPKDIIDSLDKGEELIKISKGEPTTNKTEALQAIMDNEEIKPMEPISLYEPYVFQMKRKGYGDEASISVVGVKKLKPAKDGSLPYEIKVTSKDKLKKMEELINAHESKNGFYVKATFPTGKTHVFEKKIKLSVDFIIQTEKIVGKDSIITKDV